MFGAGRHSKAAVDSYVVPEVLGKIVPVEGRSWEFLAEEDRTWFGLREETSGEAGSSFARLLTRPHWAEEDSIDLT